MSTMPTARPSRGAAWISPRAPALTSRPAAARVPANPTVSARPERRARSNRTGVGEASPSPRVWVSQAGSSAKPQGLTGATMPAAKASVSSPPMGQAPAFCSSAVIVFASGSVARKVTVPSASTTMRVDSADTPNRRDSVAP